jgi:predicted esterase
MPLPPVRTSRSTPRRAPALAALAAAALLLSAAPAHAQSDAGLPVVVQEPAVAPSDTPTLSAAPVPSTDNEPTEILPEVAPAPRPARHRTEAVAPAPPTHGPAPRESRRDRRAPPGDEPERLALHGMPGAYYYHPTAGGRQRVLVYLHARNADPRESCRRWHQSTPRFGWLLCPIGPVDRGNGRREWRNNAEYAHRESIAALEELYRLFPRRVRRHDNVIMGFSEGAYTAMNVGLMEPLTFPRWFIIAANDGYIDGEAERIARAQGSLQRIYLLTGATDGIVERTHRAHEMLRRAFGRRRVRIEILQGAGHELPPSFLRTTRNILYWVTQ